MARQLAHDATHDALTGLINRREFERRLEHTVTSTKRHGTYHVLCYLDLDQFKLVNDTAGHAAGDELLKRVRGLLAGKFRDRDTLARLGGDEFGLLLDNCELPEALGICDIIVATFRDYRFKWQGRSFRIGASMGLVPVTADAESAAQLLSQADVACYTAKELGRNQVHVYRKEGAQPSRRHTEIILVSGLQDALEQNRFVLYCQPIVDLSPDDGAPLRFEVLLRLRDGGDLVLPRLSPVHADFRRRVERRDRDQSVGQLAQRRFSAGFSHRAVCRFHRFTGPGLFRNHRDLRHPQPWQGGRVFGGNQENGLSICPR
jgi:diguanylate cyclase (GGDEF)-like protein